MPIRKFVIATLLVAGTLTLSACGGGGPLPVRDGPQMKSPVYG